MRKNILLSLLLINVAALNAMDKKIALIGEYNPDLLSHQTTNAAIEHSNKSIGTNIKSQWIATHDISIPLLKEYSGIWIAPGSCYKNIDKTLMAIKYAREHNIPCLGTCGGFQQIIIEYARNVLGHHDAQHEEYDPCSSNLFISSLSCSLTGKELNLTFVPESKVATFYNSHQATENSYCSFGINPKVIQLFKQGPLEIVGADSDNEIRAVEIKSHPFFIGTLFVPQNKSTQTNPHALITAFLKVITETTL